MGKLLFRVDSCEQPEYKQGHNIVATGGYRNYLSRLDTSNPHYYKNKIEDTLAEVGGVDRRNLLFLFDELKDALIFSSTVYEGNARIYTVETIKGIKHRGDMNLLDCLSLTINPEIHNHCPCICETMCRNYCNHKKTFSPCYEYLVQSAVVKNLLCNSDDCVNFHREYSSSANKAFLSVERTSVYFDKLKHLSSINYF